MNIRKLLALGVFLMMFGVAVLSPPATAQKTGQDTEVSAIDQEEGAAKVKVHFRSSGLSVSRIMGNVSEESTQAPGRFYGARAFGTVIGEWSMPILADCKVQGGISVHMWARSQQSAKNAGFRLNLYRSQGNMQAYFTNRGDVGATPVKFTAEGNYNQQFTQGDTLDAQVVWFSDPNYFIGPSSGGEFLYGSPKIDSFFEITFLPHPIAITNISVPEADVTRDKMKVTAQFTDYLAGDPSTMVYALGVTGPTSPSTENIDGPNPSASAGNQSSVSWIWDHKKDGGASSGDYTFTVSVSYDGNSSVTNATTVKIKVPGSGKDDGGLFGGEGGEQLLMIIGVVVAVVVVVIVVGVVVKMKRSKSSEEEEEMAEEEG